jgi:long-subunit fatty acid transport protein
MLCTSVAWASFSKVGTAAAQFLKIGIGARAMGMGETFVAVANDATALYWNPAGLSNLSSITLTINHTRWFAGISHDFVGFVVPWGDNSVLGVSAIALNTPEQEVTTVEEPEGTGIYYDVNDIAVGLTYARALTDRFATGLTAKYIQQNAYNESASTFALDIGTYLRTGYRGLTIGMSVSNFGGMMQMRGRDLIAIVDVDDDLNGDYNPDARLKTEQWPLSLNFRVGIAMDIVGGSESFLPTADNRLTVAVDGNHPNDNNERINLGAEYSWKERLFVRAGYAYKFNSTSDEREDAERLSFGAGLRFPLGEQAMNIDYAMADLNDLGQVGRFSAEYRF